MKKLFKISLITLTMAASSYAVADQFDGLTCAGKKEAIQTQLDYAQKANNTYRAQGLQKALDDVNTYCTNESLEEKYKDKVEDKLENLQDKQEDLQEAQLKGDPQKIAKRESKVKAAEYELKEAQDQLDAFYKALKAQ